MFLFMQKKQINSKKEIDESMEIISNDIGISENIYFSLINFLKKNKSENTELINNLSVLNLCAKNINNEIVNIFYLNNPVYYSWTINQSKIIGKEKINENTIVIANFSYEEHMSNDALEQLLSALPKEAKKLVIICISSKYNSLSTRIKKLNSNIEETYLATFSLLNEFPRDKNCISFDTNNILPAKKETLIKIFLKLISPHIENKSNVNNQKIENLSKNVEDENEVSTNKINILNKNSIEINHDLDNNEKENMENKNEEIFSNATEIINLNSIEIKSDFDNNEKENMENKNEEIFSNETEIINQNSIEIKSDLDDEKENIENKNKFFKPTQSNSFTKKPPPSNNFKPTNISKSKSNFT